MAIKADHNSGEKDRTDCKGNFPRLQYRKEQTHASLTFIYYPAPELTHHKDLQSIFIHVQISPNRR